MPPFAVMCGAMIAYSRRIVHKKVQRLSIDRSRMHTYTFVRNNSSLIREIAREDGEVIADVG